MPRVAINYNNTLIYKLVCNDPSVAQIYVGSTTDWKTRKSVHKRCCSNENSANYNEKKYVIIRENGGWDNWEMILIEPYPCKNNLHARKQERVWQDKLNAEMNTIRAYITEEESKERLKEYREQNKDQNKEYSKEYREQNKDQINERRREKRKQNKAKHAMT